MQSLLTIPEIYALSASAAYALFIKLAEGAAVAGSVTK